ncbi:alpha/beta hydrolase [Nocardia sp. NRRL WC-3656]|uniref:alpha/beta hydrolase n=1 Tax=Nocardia sp. NRRL WC-3656 TaxID=1463824 RepID=UPI00056843FD|nr:alpha/beta fold hydrolase [Nocardia sp. NRRL WC-3656]
MTEHDTTETVEREKVRFVSGHTQCAAWFYPGTNGACVIMAGGFAVPKEPATDQFARRFNDAGFAVLAFDYRRVGESGGQPRLAFSARDQLDDWQAAIDSARTLPGVDPAKLAVWGFSASGGHIFRVAERNPQLGAAIAQTPNPYGPAVSRNAMRHQKPLAMLRFTARGIADTLGSLMGRPPRLVSLVGVPGTVSMLTTPDGLDTGLALRSHRYPDWQQMVAARTALRFSLYRPGRAASRVRSPLLVVVCDRDQTSLVEPSVKAASRAPRGEVVKISGNHYAPFLDEHEQAVAAQLSFLHRHLFDQPTADPSGTSGSSRK